MKHILSPALILISIAAVAQPADGRIAWWKFDGDLTEANGHTGTANGTGFTTDRNGIANKALLSDADPDYVSVANQNDFNFTGDFSISLWFMRTTQAGSGTIISKQEPGSYKGFNVWYENGTISLISGTNPNVNWVKTTQAYAANVWHHVVIIRSGTTAANHKIFVDGVLDVQVINSLSSLADLTNTGTFMIARRHSMGNTFVGSIDDVMMYNRALTTQEAIAGQYDPIAACANIYCVDDGVGIKTDYIPDGFALAVKGKIMVEEVRVQTYTTWPDYVFNAGYQLPGLKATREFIRKNGHLPGIPSASDVEKKGIDLAEMNAILLKKIEELTLHVIELEERLDQVSPGTQKQK